MITALWVIAVCEAVRTILFIVDVIASAIIEKRKRVNDR